MRDIEINLMGPLRVTAACRGVALPRSRKARALLAWLALEPREHSRAELAARIWPETADPRGDLRWSLSKLRAALGADVIVSTPERVRLDTDRAATDVRRIEEWLNAPAEARGLVPRERIEAALSAEPLAGLDVAAGVELEQWLESQRQALRRVQLRALGVLLESSREHPADALHLARRRVALDPLNETAAIDLVGLTLRQSGRRPALHALEQARARLLEAGLGDAGLLAAWRRLCPPRPRPASAEDTRGRDAGSVLAGPLDRKPSVAVLGFESLGPESPALAEGLAVDLTTSLARLRSLFVIARASAARFRLAETPAPEIGLRLGVRYLVQGSIRLLDKRLRVTVDLVESERGQQLWSEHLERPLDDLFLVQEQLVDAIVAVVEPQIEQAERERARLMPTEHLGAWECFHRAMWHTYRFTRADTDAAQKLFRRALGQDPGFARAYAGISFNHFSKAFLNASDDADAEIAMALEAARESVSLEPRDALGHWCLGRALFLGRAHDQALTAIDRSLAVNPNSAQGHYAKGFIGCHAGLADDVPRDLDRARRLSPFDPLLFAMDSSRAIALAVRGRHGEAATWAVRATQQPNAHFHIFAIAAACLELAGRRGEAVDNVRTVRELHPGYTVSLFERSFPHASEHDRRTMSGALLAAGIAP